MKQILLPFFILLTYASSAQQSFTWAKVADYPYAAWGMSSCNYNGTLYTFSNCGSGNNTLYSYTESTDKWDTLAKLPGTAFCNTAMAGVAGKIYLLGSAILYSYDIATDTWTNSVSLPAGLIKDGASMVVAGTDVYIAGGGTSTTVNFFKFNTSTQTFSSLAPMATARENAQVALQGNKIYAIGGRSSGSALSTGEVYDISTDTWSALVPVFEKRYFGFAIADTDYIYLLGGETGTNSFKYKSIELFDPANNTVTMLTNANDMNVEHTAYALGISGTKLVAAAGFTNTPNNAVTDYCESTVFSQAVSIMQAEKASIDFSLFPNPAGNVVFVRCGDNATFTQVDLYNYAGQLIKSIGNHNRDKQVAIEVSNLPAGLYFIKATNAAGVSQQRTFVINH